LLKEGNRDIEKIFISLFFPKNLKKNKLKKYQGGSIMLSISNNVSSLIAGRNINNSLRGLNSSILRLSTGKKINSAADDAAGLAIATRLKTSISSMMQSRNNADSGYSLLQVAEGAMFEITSIIQRLNTLAMQAANETLTNSDRQLIQAEVNELVAEIDRMASAVTFNGIPLLKGSTIVGSGSIGIQVGYNAVSNIGINLLTMTSASLGLTNLDLTSVANAQAAISSLSSTLSSAVKQYAKIGALQNRVGYASDFLDVQKLHFTSALSAIEDTDFAEELTKYSQKKIMVETGINMLAQSNLMMEKVLNLLELKK